MREELFGEVERKVLQEAINTALRSPGHEFSINGLRLAVRCPAGRCEDDCTQCQIPIRSEAVISLEDIHASPFPIRLGLLRSMDILGMQLGSERLQDLIQTARLDAVSRGIIGAVAKIPVDVKRIVHLE